MNGDVGGIGGRINSGGIPPPGEEPNNNGKCQGRTWSVLKGSLEENKLKEDLTPLEAGSQKINNFTDDGDLFGNEADGSQSRGVEDSKEIKIVDIKGKILPDLNEASTDSNHATQKKIQICVVVLQQVAQLTNNLSKLMPEQEQIKTTESQVKTTESQVKTTESQVKTTESQVKTTESKLKDIHTLNKELNTVEINEFIKTVSKEND